MPPFFLLKSHFEALLYAYIGKEIITKTDGDGMSACVRSWSTIEFMQGFSKKSVNP